MPPLFDRTFDLDTKSELNIHEHGLATHRRRKAQARVVLAHLLASGASGKKVAAQRPLQITLTRLASRNLDRTDNLPSAFKAVIDQICRWLGVDDGDASLTITCRQEACRKAGQPKGIRIQIDPLLRPRPEAEDPATAIPPEAPVENWPPREVE